MLSFFPKKSFSLSLVRYTVLCTLRSYSLRMRDCSVTFLGIYASLRAIQFYDRICKVEIKQFLVFHLIFFQQNQILDLENLSKLTLKTAPV